VLQAKYLRDGVTEDQTLLISWHPDHGNLGMAWGASYTHGKDLPIIGRIIDQILLHDKPSEEFGWLSASSIGSVPHNQPLLWTDRLFSDMNDDATRDREVQIFMEQEDFQYI
jgi:hypothetical protein